MNTVIVVMEFSIDLPQQQMYLGRGKILQVCDFLRRRGRHLSGADQPILCYGRGRSSTPPWCVRCPTPLGASRAPSVMASRPSSWEDPFGWVARLSLPLAGCI